MNKTAKIAVAAGFVLLLAYMVYLSMAGSQVSCEVCMEFRGNTDCRRASGKTEEEAQASAASTACSLLSGGVTDGIACRSTQPKSVSCQAR